MFFKEVSIGWAVLIFCSSTLSLYISAYAFHRRQVIGAKALSFFMFSVAMYSLGYALEINSESLSKIIDALKFEVFWATFTAPAFLLFVVQFVNKKSPPQWFSLALFIFPVVIGALALTNDQHTLLYQKYWIEEGANFPLIKYEPAIGYIIQLAYLILLSLLAEALLLAYFFRCKGVEKKKTILMFIAGVLPTLSAMLNPDRATFSGLDLQPFVFSITGILLAIALFYFKMLDLRKVAREFAMDAIHDYLLIIDKNMVLVDINQAGKNSTLLHSCQVGSALPEDNTFVSNLKSSIAQKGTSSKNKIAVTVQDKHYQYSLITIKDSFRYVQGYVVLVNDCTTMVDLLSEMELLAIMDSLTNVFNRRHLINLAKREIKIASRNSSSLSVILFDLDNFKSINDSFGHPMGDIVLKNISKAVQSELRTTEIFGRYGGEEFCVICPNTGKEDAKSIAERLRQCIENIDWSEHLTHSVTASFGVCTSSTCNQVTIEELFSRADLALYQAKGDGKNRISQYGI